MAKSKRKNKNRKNKKPYKIRKKARKTRKIKKPKRGPVKIHRHSKKRTKIPRRASRKPKARSVLKPKRSIIPRRKLTYTLNPDFSSFYELRDLVLKSQPAEKNRMVEKINKLGRVKLAVISGVFINKDNLDPLIPDLLIVCDDADSRKLRLFLKSLEAEVGKEIKFAIMDKEEFQYRLAMFDRFIRVLLEGHHEKLINRLGI